MHHSTATHHAEPPHPGAVLLSLVVPVYRSAATLAELAARLHAVGRATAQPYELVFVDDGSPDDSWAVLAMLQAADPAHVVAVRLMRNFGQHNALMCGFRVARGQVLVTLDDDLQNPPEEIPKLLATLEAQQADLVYGRYDHKQHAAWRNLGSWLVNSFYRFVFQSRITVSSFRAVRRELVESVLTYRGNFTFVDGLFAWNTQRVAETLVDHHPRRHGRTGYSLAKLATLGLNLWTNFSLAPLHLVTLTGCLLATAGFGTGLYYLIQYFANQITVSGYASTIVAVLVLGGAQLMALGVLSEYLGRLHLNVNRKPQYSVRTLLGSPAERTSPTTTCATAAALPAAQSAPQPTAAAERTVTEHEA